MINYKVIKINLIILLIINGPIFLPVFISNKSFKKYIKLGPKLENSLGKQIYSRYRDIVQYNEKCFKKDYLFAISPKRNSSCEHESIEFQTSLYFGDYGNRTSKKIKRFNKKSELVIIGDSHAMGFGVKNEETFSHYLSSKNVPNLNLAVSGYSTFLELKRLEDFSAKNSQFYKNIRTIVIQYCDNDLNSNRYYQIKSNKFNIKNIDRYHNLIDKRSEKIIWEFGENNLYEDRQKALGSIIIFYQYYFNKVKSFARLFLSNFIDKYKFIPENEANHADPFFKVLERFPSLLKDKNIIILISSSWGKDDKIIEKQFKEASKKYSIGNDIKVLEPNLSQIDYFMADEHLNKEGHQKLGIELLKIIN